MTFNREEIDLCGTDPTVSFKSVNWAGVLVSGGGRGRRLSGDMAGAKTPGFDHRSTTNVWESIHLGPLWPRGIRSDCRCVLPILRVS